MNVGRIMQWALLTFFAMQIVGWSPAWRDDTDEPGWFGQRSGVVLVVDHATGCHYLQPRWGGVIPRFNGHGDHVGCKEY